MLVDDNLYMHTQTLIKAVLLNEKKETWHILRIISLIN